MFRYYIIAILSGSTLIAVLNELLVSPKYGMPVLHAATLTLIAVLCAFGIDALIALASRYAIPKRYYNPLRRRFSCARFEKKLYMRLGIRAWKDKIPETGGLLVGFQKSHALNLRDNEYVYEFMRETCYAEVMHIWSAIFCFVLLPLFSPPYRLSIALPVAAVNFVLQILPVLVQRFVRPQLTRVYFSNKRREEKAQEQEL